MNKENSENPILKKLFEQIALLKEGTLEEISLLKERNQEFVKIERRIEAAFPGYKEVKSPSPKSIDKNNREEMLKMREELKTLLQEKGEHDFSRQIKAYSADAVKALASELGISVKSKSITDKVRKEIKNCLQESIALQKPVEFKKEIAQGALFNKPDKPDEENGDWNMAF